MKRAVIMATVATVAFLAACTGGKSEYMQRQIDSLTTVVNQQQTDMADMTYTLDVVAAGIDSINRQENIIYMGVDEVTGKRLSGADIRQRIKDLEALIVRQRERISTLEDSLSSRQDARIAGLKSVIASLNRQLEEKQSTIDQLEAKVRSQKQDINRLSNEKTLLTQHVEMQEEALNAQSDIINEGYYIIGTRKELKEAGVITVNLLQQSKLNLEGADTEKMQKIDIRTFSDELVIDSKKPKILTHMPEQSYSMVVSGKQTRLFIKDPALFWSMSKILVIQK